MLDLDEAFGAAIAAEPIRRYETRKQSTWLMVDAASGVRLQALIDHVGTDAYLSSYLNDEFTTLWLIAEDGSVRVAIEEFVLEDHSRHLTAPMPRGYGSKTKIGHPGLVEGLGGRIGGELAVNRSDGKCYLTNASGRFGYSRSAGELENAAERFREFGVQVIARYVRSTWQ